jgi:methionyl-tRNA synthetase
VSGNLPILSAPQSFLSNGLMEKYYITTAIDYVNAAPHIGHAYEKIATDVLARYYRLHGRDVFFLTGVDEHGVRIEKIAKEAGKSPQDFCDEMSAKFKETWKSLEISYDYFIRTTEKRHATSVQELFRRLQLKGDVYKSSYEGLYCEGCEDFWRERDLDPDGNCPNHKKPPKRVSEENFFFRLSKYKPAIKKWLESDATILRPESRRNEVLRQLEDPELTDFSVSRSRNTLTWGIPVPDDSAQVIYVWLDALTNYITGAGFATDDTSMRKWWPADLHMIGKDITKFHSIYWPAMLMAGDLPLPNHIYAHGFITVEGQKISKSLGNVIDPQELVSKYGADALRFYLLAANSFDQDGDFSQDEFIKKVNADLANNLGNLLNRTLKLLGDHCGGLVPNAEPDHTLREQANELHKVIEKRMEELDFGKAIEAILALSDVTNKYLASEKPWDLFKKGEQKRGEVVLYSSLEMLRRTALNIFPFTPNLAQVMWKQLGFRGELKDLGGEKGEAAFFEVIPPGQKTSNYGPIFKRFE